MIDDVLFVCPLTLTKHVFFQVQYIIRVIARNRKDKESINIKKKTHGHDRFGETSTTDTKDW